MDVSSLIDDLINKPYWIVDILPERVPEDSPGQYFAVEQYYLADLQRTAIHRKYAEMILKLNCYFDIIVSTDAGNPWEENPDSDADISWEKNPTPERLADLITNIDPTGTIYVLFKEENTLIVINGDDTYMTVCNPSREILNKLQQLAVGEGVYIWR